MNEDVLSTCPDVAFIDDIEPDFSLVEELFARSEQNFPQIVKELAEVLSIPDLNGPQ